MCVRCFLVRHGQFGISAVRIRIFVQKNGDKILLRWMFRWEWKRGWTNSMYFGLNFFSAAFFYWELWAERVLNTRTRCPAVLRWNGAHLIRSFDTLLCMKLPWKYRGLIPVDVRIRSEIILRLLRGHTNNCINARFVYRLLSGMLSSVPLMPDANRLNWMADCSRSIKSELKINKKIYAPLRHR